MAAAQICKGLVTPLLTSEDDDVISPTFVLNMLMKCLSCGLISTENRAHWILDQEPLQLLFVLLEMYQDCEQFWNEWVTNSRSVNCGLFYFGTRWPPIFFTHTP